MNATNINKIMNFVRVDGPIDAPLRFLTIEDGGGFSEDKVENREKFFEYFKAENEHQMPEKIDGRGKPAVFISKIVSFLINKELSKSKFYMNNSLYKKNESNFKFYPISRRKMKDWNKNYTKKKYFGINKQEYEELCHLIRPEIIVENKYYKFNTDYNYIILGAKIPWLHCLKLMFKRENINIDFLKTKSVNDSKGNTIYQFYYDNTGKLAFSYFSIFRLGVSENDIKKFSDELLIEKPELILNLKIN
jgi:hypothetical protein